MIEKGNQVTLDYEGRFEDGTVFDTSKHGDHSHPLTFEVGAGQVIAGFDLAVIGMKVGEEKEFEISPEEGYGEHNPDLKQKIPKNAVPQSEKVQKGMQLVMSTPQGQIPVNVLDVDEESITLDLNHPLAGKKLIFKIKVLKIE